MVLLGSNLNACVFQSGLIQTAGLSGFLKRCESNKFNLPIQPVNTVNGPTLSGLKLGEQGQTKIETFPDIPPMFLDQYLDVALVLKRSLEPIARGRC